MTDMTAFERQVASEMVRRAGPVRPVDDLAVFDAITTATRSPRWRSWSTSMPSANGYPITITGRTYTMFTPVKAIVAGALIFTLLGVLSIAQPFDQQGATVPAAPVASPSPSATPAQAQEGDEPVDDTATCGEGLGTLTLTVSNLIGMEGQELTAVVGEMGGLPPELFDLVIDGSPFEATDSGCFEAGKRWLSIAIGEPPCSWPIGPQCAHGGYQHCDLQFEALPGEDVWVWIEGNPVRHDGCPVLYLGHTPGP